MEKNKIIALEIERQKFLYKYWNDAERIETMIFISIFVTILVPSIIKLDFTLFNIGTWIVIAIFFFIIKELRSTFAHYTKEQRKIRKFMENLKF